MYRWIGLLAAAIYAAVSSHAFAQGVDFGGNAPFSGITGGPPNTSAAMVCGTGCSISTTGSGAISATSSPVSGLSGLGTGVATALGTNVGSAGAFVTNGGALGTPSSGTLTNAAGLPVGGISGLGTGVATWLATPSSANLASAVTGETGTGALVFGTSPTLVTPALGTPSAAVLTNATGLPAASVVAGALANGMTATTQTTGDNTTKVATDAFVIANAGSGGTTLILGAGLASTPGTYNPGTQTATNGSAITPQSFYKSIAASCTVNSTCTSGTNDSAYILTATAASVTYTLPNPAAVGAGGFTFGYDGSHAFSLTTAGGTATFYGSCGAGATTYSSVANSVTVLTDGTNYQCFPNSLSGGSISGLTTNVIPKASSSTSIANSSVTDNGTVVNTTEPIEISSKKIPAAYTWSIGWVAGQSPNNASFIVVPVASTISSITGRLVTAEGSSGTVSVYTAASGTACASGTNLTNTTSFNTNGTASTNQTLSGTTTSVAAGANLCLVTTGTFTTNIGVITVVANPT